jgi:hypothetical protein
VNLHVRRADPETGCAGIRPSRAILVTVRDMAVGEFAAVGTEEYVAGPYRFEKLEGKSHWLIDEAPEQISAFVPEHLCANAA